MEEKAYAFSVVVAVGILSACGESPRQLAASDPSGRIEQVEVGAIEPAVVRGRLHTETSSRGNYSVEWTPLGRLEVPKNEHFELEVRLLRTADDQATPAPVPGIQLVVSAWMPDHEHGMLRRAQAIDHGDGSYTVRGMLLHMAGRWELYFDVIENGVFERTEFELEL